ncbi:uncharacterized protein LOC118434830 isoform X1 [Folsomia candida]|uniref:uncharacterized protein LOC118434830 isoform X1 n=1 Tax=Folsomia candida TaxID=158441 RepID=UPI001605404A|nr:uncharacterized protein LOC118434830 isoform X1 [Folsomia candida]
MSKRTNKSDSGKKKKPRLVKEEPGAEESPSISDPTPSTSRSISKASLKQKEERKKNLETEKFKCIICGKIFITKSFLDAHTARVHVMDDLSNSVLGQVNPFNVERVTPLQMWGSEEEIVQTPERKKLFDNYDKHRKLTFAQQKNKNISSVYLVLLIPEPFLYKNGKQLAARELKAWLKANQSKILHLYWYIGTTVGSTVGIDQRHFAKRMIDLSPIYDYKINKGFRAFLVKQWVFSSLEKDENVRSAKLLEAWIQVFASLRKRLRNLSTNWIELLGKKHTTLLEILTNLYYVLMIIVVSRIISLRILKRLGVLDARVRG